MFLLHLWKKTRFCEVLNSRASCLYLIWCSQRKGLTCSTRTNQWNSTLKVGTTWWDITLIRGKNPRVKAGRKEVKNAILQLWWSLHTRQNDSTPKFSRINALVKTFHRTSAVREMFSKSNAALGLWSPARKYTVWYYSKLDFDLGSRANIACSGNDHHHRTSFYFRKSHVLCVYLF